MSTDLELEDNGVFVDFVAVEVVEVGVVEVAVDEGVVEVVGAAEHIQTHGGQVDCVDVVDADNGVREEVVVVEIEEDGVEETVVAADVDAVDVDVDVIVGVEAAANCGKRLFIAAED